jgi:hypothetical protein
VVSSLLAELTVVKSNIARAIRPLDAFILGDFLKITEVCGPNVWVKVMHLE